MSVYLLNESSFLDHELTESDIDIVKTNAAAGEIEAQYHLALMFDAGRGVARNPKEAELLYKKAADAGHAGAQYYLGRMYSSDNSGVARNDAEAKRLYMQAAMQGHQDALAKIEELAY